MKRIAILQGHPDPAGGHFNHALADAYADGARAGGHEVRTIPVAALDFPVLRAKALWEDGPVPPAILAAQQDIAWADHLAIFYPLWLGAEPALLKAFLEQALRPGFAVPRDRSRPGGAKPLAGRSARIVATMGMPAFFYRWYFGAHSVKNLKRNILGFCGFAPVKDSLIGMIEAEDGRARSRWLARMAEFGRAAA